MTFVTTLTLTLYSPSKSTVGESVGGFSKMRQRPNKHSSKSFLKSEPRDPLDHHLIRHLQPFVPNSDEEFIFFLPVPPHYISPFCTFHLLSLFRTYGNVMSTFEMVRHAQFTRFKGYDNYPLFVREAFSRIE